MDTINKQKPKYPPPKWVEAKISPARESQPKPDLKEARAQNATAYIHVYQEQRPFRRTRRTRVKRTAYIGGATDKLQL